MAAGRVVLDPGSFISNLVCYPNKGVVSYTRMHHWSNKLDVLIMATESGWHTEDFKAPSEGLRQEGVPKGAPTRPAAASRRPLTKKAKLCLAAALAIVLALIVGVVSVRATNSEHTPEAAVREYVQLISDGKYDEASKLVDPSSSVSDCKMLSSKTFSGVKGAVKFDSINNFKYDENYDIATVNVVVLVNGRSVESELQLSKTRGVNNWKVVSPLLVNVEFQGHPYLYSYKIGSVVLDVGYRERVGYGSSISCEMYPGVYNIEGQSVNPEYVEINSVGKQFVAVAMQHGSTGSESDFYASFEFNKHFTVKPTEKLKTWALPQIQSRIKSCASISYPRKDNSCPVEVWSSDYINVKALEVQTLPTTLHSVGYVNGTSLIAARADAVIKVTTAESRGTSGQEISETKDFYYNAIGIVDFDKERQPVLKWSI